MSTARQAPPAVAQLAILLVGAAACAAVAQKVLPHRIPWVGRWADVVAVEARRDGVAVVELEEVRRIVERQSHLLLDARPPADYDAGRLPGAFNLPAGQLDAYLPGMLPMLTPAQPLLVYCSGASCDESLQLARLLHKNGCTNIVLFAGGFSAWRAAGLKVDR